MDALFFAVCIEFGGRVVRVQFDLVDGGDDFQGRVVEMLFQVLDAKVGNADVADFAACGELLEILPVGGVVMSV